MKNKNKKTISYNAIVYNPQIILLNTLVSQLKKLFSLSTESTGECHIFKNKNKPQIGNIKKNMYWFKCQRTRN